MRVDAGIDLLRVVRNFLVEPRLIQLIADGDLDEVAANVSQVERALHRLGIAADADRATLLARLFLEDLAKLSDDAGALANRLFNVELTLDDLQLYQRFVEHAGAVFEAGRYDIRRGPNLVAEFNKNLSTGLKRKAGYRDLKGYLANNHLLARFLRDPDFLMAGIQSRLDGLAELGYELPERLPVTAFLENAIEAGTKIDDLHIRQYLPDCKLNIDGQPIDLSKILEYVRISVDSKFYLRPNAINSGKTLYQQSALTIGDRMGQLYEVMRALEHTTDAEFDDAIGRILPIIFQHYVAIPPDTGSAANPLGISGQVCKELADEVGKDFGNHLRDWVKDLGFEPESRVDMVLAAADDFIEEHFADGAFILKHELRYHDLPP